MLQIKNYANPAQDAHPRAEMRTMCLIAGHVEIDKNDSAHHYYRGFATEKNQCLVHPESFDKRLKENCLQRSFTAPVITLPKNWRQFLDSVITGDETWIFEYDPETKRQNTEYHTLV